MILSGQVTAKMRAKTLHRSTHFSLKKFQKSQNQNRGLELSPNRLKLKKFWKCEIGVTLKMKLIQPVAKSIQWVMTSMIGSHHKKHTDLFEDQRQIREMGCKVRSQTLEQNPDICQFQRQSLSQPWWALDEVLGVELLHQVIFFKL